MSFLDQMKQLMDIKQKMEEVKKQLEAREVIAENDYVKVTANGNRKIMNVTVLRTDDAAALSLNLQSAINEALERSEKLMQSEMMGVTKGMLPDSFPGVG